MNFDKVRRILYTFLPKKLYFTIINFYRKIITKEKKYKNPIKEITIKDQSKEFMLKLDLRNGQTEQKIFEKKEQDPLISAAIAKHVKKGGVFVDIGANIGYYSMLASKLVGSTGKVYSFEPVSFLYEQLTYNKKINAARNITSIQKGCGNKKENLTIHINYFNTGTSSVVMDDLSDDSSETIQIDTLDAMITPKKIDFIKIDVEGFEYNVLLGAKKQIKKHKPGIILEYSPNLYDTYFKNQQIPSKIFKLLEKEGYEFYNPDKKKKILNYSKLILHMKKHNETINLLCVPKK